MRKAITMISLILIVFVSGCITGEITKGDKLSENVVEKGNTVKVNYIGTLNDGTVFDTSLKDVAKENNIYNEQRPYEPLEFKVGSGQMIKGFDDAVVGMKEGETKKINLKPDEAYGQKNPEMVKEVPKQAFEQSGIPPVGTAVFFQGGLQGTVQKVNDETVTVDFNHPMAGKELNFEITLMDIQ